MTMILTEKLREKGYKVTSIRKNIYSVLSLSPVSIRQIAGKLKKKKKRIDLVSIYRSLELFAGLGLADEVSLGDGKKRYELVDVKRHHHHLVCDRCGVIEDVLLDLENKIIREAEKKSEFIISKHSLEFFGLCKQCQ